MLVLTAELHTVAQNRFGMNNICFVFFFLTWSLYLTGED